MSKLLFDEQPLVIDRKLAKELGLNEAIVIQQIHYWLKINEAKNTNFHDERYWTYNSTKEWHENHFDFWSFDTVKRTFAKLEKMEILLVGNYNKDKRDRTKWYTLNYKKLDELVSKNSKSAKCPNALDESENNNKCNNADCYDAKVQIPPMQSVDMHQPLPEISSENYTEISNNNNSVVVVDKNTQNLIAEVKTILPFDCSDDKDITTMLELSNYNLNVIQKAIESFVIYSKGKTIHNPVGVLVMAIKDKWIVTPITKGTPKQSTLKNYEEDEKDKNYDEIMAIHKKLTAKDLFK